MGKEVQLKDLIDNIINNSPLNTIETLAQDNPNLSFTAVQPHTITSKSAQFPWKANAIETAILFERWDVACFLIQKQPPSAQAIHDYLFLTCKILRLGTSQDTTYKPFVANLMKKGASFEAALQGLTSEFHLDSSTVVTRKDKSTFNMGCVFSSNEFMLYKLATIKKQEKTDCDEKVEEVTRFVRMQAVLTDKRHAQVNVFLASYKIQEQELMDWFSIQGPTYIQAQLLFNYIEVHQVVLIPNMVRFHEKVMEKIRSRDLVIEDFPEKLQNVLKQDSSLKKTNCDELVNELKKNIGFFPNGNLSQITLKGLLSLHSHLFILLIGNEKGVLPLAKIMLLHAKNLESEQLLIGLHLIYKLYNLDPQTKELALSMRKLFEPKINEQQQELAVVKRENKELKNQLKESQMTMGIDESSKTEDPNNLGFF